MNIRCASSASRGIVEPATICDHVEPHYGDVNKFWLGPFMSLCKRCHDSTKRLVETRGFRPDVDLDGWPVDPRPGLSEIYTAVSNFSQTFDASGRVGR